MQDVEILVLLFNLTQQILNSKYKSFNWSEKIKIKFKNHNSMETVIFSVIPETHIFFQYRHNHFSFQIHFDQHLPSIAKSAENSEYHK